MSGSSHPDTARIWDILNEIPDPEVPAISIVELGVVREVNRVEQGTEVVMTPTYSGCPAMKAMEDAVRERMKEEGIEVSIRIVYKPAWTTDWMSETTKAKLKAYGIAPPPKLTFEHLHPLSSTKGTEVKCPFCDSKQTRLTSQFGSTACKALYYCEGCQQPFEHFKCH
ncbi:MAG: phenylacetate-CoA oxygenase subunit PaaJ [Bacteroidia bacterium]|nr:phenylacetate-CoA oxygenase subunit PaaJ [Bacteroidia bacterium]